MSKSAYTTVSVSDSSCVNLAENKFEAVDRLNVVLSQPEYLAHVTKTMIAHPRRLKSIEIHFVTRTPYYR